MAHPNTVAQLKMRPLTKKYIFECRLKGEAIKIWAEYYNDKKTCWSEDTAAAWLKDIDILEEAGIVTPMINGLRTFLYETVVIYPKNRYVSTELKHWLRKDTVLSFRKGPDAYHIYPDQDDD